MCEVKHFYFTIVTARLRASLVFSYYPQLGWELYKKPRAPYNLTWLGVLPKDE